MRVFTYSLGFNAIVWVIVGIGIGWWPLCRCAIAQSGPTTAPDSGAESVPSSAPSDAQIQQLIQQLSDDNADVRRNARAALVKIGPAAAKALEDHIRAREEAQATLGDIEVNQVVTATEVTCHLQNVTPLAAMAELSKVTGYSLQPFNLEMFNQTQLPLVSVDADHRSFWEVVQKLCDDGQITMQPSGTPASRQLRFMPGGRFGNMQGMNAPSYLNGAFLFIARSISRSSMIQLGTANPPSRQMSVQIELLAEPKVRVSNLTLDVDACKAVDDRGASLTLPDRGMGGGMSFGGSGMMMNFSVPLKYAEQSGGKITSLEGQVKLSVYTDSETAQILDVNQGGDIEKEAAGQKIILRGTRKINSNQYQLQVTFCRGDMDPQLFQQAAFQRMQNPGIRLFDANGREFPYSGSAGMQSSGPDSSTLGLMFSAEDAAMGPPQRLVWEASRSTREVPVTFKFSDLPLP
jgi:hypothetical protein